MRFGVGTAVLLLAAFALAGEVGGMQSSRSLPRNGLIAYDSDVAGPTTEIYVMNPDGSSKRRLTQAARRSVNVSPSWSPDGRRIVFVHGGKCGINCVLKGQLWVMNADGSRQRRLTNNRGSEDGNPAWSPDGKYIAFDRCPNTGCDNADIYLIRPDGTGERPVTRDGRSAEPAWSPAGTRIAFTGVGADGRADIYVMNKDGSGPRNLTADIPQDGGAEPAWSPDGRTIAFNHGFTLAFMSPDGTHRRHLNAPDRAISEPAWSPDGKWIVFQTQQTLYVVNSAGTKSSRVAFDGDNHHPTWQPLLRRG